MIGECFIRADESAILIFPFAELRFQTNLHATIARLFQKRLGLRRIWATRDAFRLNALQDGMQFGVCIDVHKNVLVSWVDERHVKWVLRRENHGRFEIAAHRDETFVRAASVGASNIKFVSILDGGARDRQKATRERHVEGSFLDCDRKSKIILDAIGARKCCIFMSRGTFGMCHNVSVHVSFTLVGGDANMRL